MPITKEMLNQFNQEYKENSLQKVVRHALHQNEINKTACVMEEQSRVLNHFSVDLKTLPVANQKQSGRCWIFAGLNVLREEVAKHINMDSFELSQNYTAFWDKFEKINYTMESLIRLKNRDYDDRTLTWVLETGVQDGGQWDMFTAIVKKYGVVPQSVMPETYASSHTREMNMLINRRLRKFAVEIRALNDIEIEKLKRNLLQKFYNLLCSCFGVPPQNFDFEYYDKDKNYHKVNDLTPHIFFDQFVDVNLNEYVSLIQSPTKDKPYHQLFTVDYLGNVSGIPVRYINLPMQELKDCVLKQLQDGHAVWFGSDCGKYGDREQGYWDQDAFDFNSMFEMDFTISKEDALNTRESAMNHAMVLTGVNVENDKTTKWKIENSWGDEHANKGYYVCSDAWFDTYVYQAVVHKKYVSNEILDVLNQDSIHLNPWDPMGTLAN